MRIFITFANRKYNPDLVELVDAWDEFSVDENPSGYTESREVALASLGDDLFRWVTAEIDVDATVIYDALNPELGLQGRVVGIEGGDD